MKLELLDNKHVQDIVFQLRRLMAGLTTFHVECQELMKDAKLFPIEVDLTRNSFQYKSTMPVVQVVQQLTFTAKCFLELKFPSSFPT